MRHYWKRKYSRLEILSTGNARSIQSIFHKPTVSLFLRAAREPRWPNDEDARCSCNGPETSTDGCHGRRNAKKKKYPEWKSRNYKSILAEWSLKGDSAVNHRPLVTGVDSETYQQFYTYLYISLLKIKTKLITINMFICRAHLCPYTQHILIKKLHHCDNVIIIYNIQYIC